VCDTLLSDCLLEADCHRALKEDILEGMQELLRDYEDEVKKRFAQVCAVAHQHTLGSSEKYTVGREYPSIHASRKPLHPSISQSYTPSIHPEKPSIHQSFASMGGVSVCPSVSLV
jgi:hypothetical protein